MGIYTKRDEHGRFLARVILPYQSGTAAHLALAKTMEPEPTFELATAAAHSWAQKHIQAMYEFGGEDLVITLLDGPEFGKVEML